MTIIIKYDDNHAEVLDDEHRVNALVGSIVRNWSQLDFFVHSEIHSLQMIIRARHNRIPRVLYPGTPYDFAPTQRIQIEHPNRRWTTKFKYFRRLCRILHSDSEFHKAIERISGPVAAAYIIRNHCAHGLITPNLGQESVDIRNYEWYEDYSASRLQPRQGQKIVDLKKTYSFSELEQTAKEINKLWWELRDLVGKIPIVGTPVEPPQKP